MKPPRLYFLRMFLSGVKLISRDRAETGNVSLFPFMYVATNLKLQPAVIATNNYPVVQAVDPLIKVKGIPEE